MTLTGQSLKERLTEILGKEYFHGVLGDNTVEANLEFSYIAKRKLAENKNADWYCGFFFIKEDEDDLDIPLFTGLACRSSSKMSKSEVMTIIVDMHRKTMNRLHSYGIEGCWNGKIDSPIFLDYQLDMEASIYEKDTKKFQSWYSKALYDNGIEEGEDDTVSKLYVDFLQKCALSGMDPWMIDFENICKKYGVNFEEPISELFIRRLILDVDSRRKSHEG